MNNEIPPIETPQHGFEAMASLINRQIDGLEQLWVSYKTYPYEEDADSLETTIALHTESVEEALEAYREQCASDKEAREKLFLYINGLETRRAAYLEKMFEESEFSNFMITPRAVTPDEMTADDDLFGESDEADADDVENRDVVHIASTYYADVLHKDMLELERCAIMEYINRPEARRMEVASKIGRHCLDIAKVSVGVVAGIVVAKKAKLL